MTFFQWIRKCLFWDEKQRALPEKNKADLRQKVIGARAKQSAEIDAQAESIDESSASIGDR